MLALDTPSGLDPTTGSAGTPAVRAAATLTLALPKAGLLDAPSAGELYLADISVPPLVYQRMGIAVPELFRRVTSVVVGGSARVTSAAWYLVRRDVTGAGHGLAIPGGAGMQPPPSVIVFDANETLSDVAPLAGRFADTGAPELLAKVWFAALLRDGFALTATGGMETFARLAAGALRAVLAGASLNRPADDAMDHILAGFADLRVHPDVPGTHPAPAQPSPGHTGQRVRRHRRPATVQGGHPHRVRAAALGR